MRRFVVCRDGKAPKYLVAESESWTKSVDKATLFPDREEALTWIEDDEVVVPVEVTVKVVQ